jgi:hypothetical protein
MPTLLHFVKDPERKDARDAPKLDFTMPPVRAGRSLVFRRTRGRGDPFMARHRKLGALIRALTDAIRYGR